MVLARVVKPKNQRAKRALEKTEPKIFENDKRAIFIKGGRTSDIVTQALKEMYMIKKPAATMFKKKNITRPFEDQTSVEFFAKKSDASLFMFGSHSKKRPHNLVLGRLYDSHVLDMVELGITKFKSLAEFKTKKIATGSKPCLLFAGEIFDQDYEYKNLKNLLLDVFRGPKATQIRLAGLEHVIMVTAAEGKLYFRSYRTLLKKSGSRLPRVELEEIGPSLDLEVRRTKYASADLFKRARKQPKEAKPKKKKNVSQDAFGTKLGRIHMTKQDLGTLQTRKVKALKRKNEDKDGKETKDTNSEKTARVEEAMDVK